MEPSERTPEYGRRLVNTFVTSMVVSGRELVINFNVSDETVNKNKKNIPDKLTKRKFVWDASGPSGENRTHGLLNPIVLLSKTQCTIRYCLDSVIVKFQIYYIILFHWMSRRFIPFVVKLWSNDPDK